MAIRNEELVQECFPKQNIPWLCKEAGDELIITLSEYNNSYQSVKTQNIWDIESVKTEKFKFELDKFLDTIPDQPKMPNYVTTSGSNSILDQLTHQRAQGIYHNGGVLDSAMEHS